MSFVTYYNNSSGYDAAAGVELEAILFRQIQPFVLRLYGGYPQK